MLVMLVGEGVMLGWYLMVQVLVVLGDLVFVYGVLISVGCGNFLNVKQKFLKCFCVVVFVDYVLKVVCDQMVGYGGMQLG